MTDGAICNGGERFERRLVGLCPIEKRRRRIVGRFQHWYGWEWYCAGCGDRWADGELGSRPFERGWRAKAIAKHKAWWAAVPAGNNRAAFLAFVRAYFDEAVPPSKGA